MKKFLKIIFLAITNILFILSLIVCSDILVYKSHVKEYLDDKNMNKFPMPNFQYIVKEPSIMALIQKNYFTGEDNVGYTGRKPVGLKYKDKMPITIFGCSVAFSQYLNPNQTLDYKLSQELKRPVYNRAIPGTSIQYMYYQVNEGADFFFNEVPKSDIVIYNMIGDHYRRMLGEPYLILDTFFMLHYKFKNGVLQKDNYNNIFYNLYKSSYTFKVLRQKFIEKYLENPKNEDKITDEFLAYFINTKKILDKQWNQNTKFFVILYGNIPYRSTLINKLKKNNFYIIETNEIIPDDDITSEEYNQDNGHPYEHTWDILVPFFAQKIKEIEN